MYSSPDNSGKHSPPPSSGFSSNPNAMMGENSPEPEEEYIYMKVIVYDRGSQSINLKISRKNITRDVTKIVTTKLKFSREEGKLHNLVMVLTTTDLKHCIRTLKPDEVILDVFETIMKKLCEKYQVADPTKLRASVRWFYKDTRTPPLDLGDSGITVGEYDSDDEENLSESDCFYFSKVEKKGYMLKRSNKDTNVWKRWYCVLADHLWCIDFNREPYKVICVRLHSLVRTKDGHSFSDQIQNIIVNSLKGSHYFRTFNIVDQRSWIDHLQAWTSYAMDNESMSMAEVIMNDEEESKSRRYRKQMERVLNSETVYAAICVDRRRPTVTMVPSNKKAVDIEEDLLSIADYFSHNDTEDIIVRESVTIMGDDNEKNEVQTLRRPHSDSGTSTSPEDELTDVNNTQFSIINITEEFSSSIEDNNNSKKVTTTSDNLPLHLSLPKKEGKDVEASTSPAPTRNSSPTKTRSSSFPSSMSLAPPIITCSSYASLHPLDRTVTQPTIHRLHQHEFLLSYLMGFVLEVLQYKELFRHDLFCSVQSQRDAAFHIFTKYFHKQARRAGIALHHDKLREIADEQAEIASSRLKEAMATQFNLVRSRDAYIMSPGSLIKNASHIAAHNSHSHASDIPSGTSLPPSSIPPVNTFNSAAMRNSSNAQRQRDQSLLVQRLRAMSSSKDSAPTPPQPPAALTSVVSSPTSWQDEITEDNWQLPSNCFDKIIQSLFGELIRVQIESEDDQSNLENGELSFSPTRQSTLLSSHDIKSLASSRKAAGPNSPNPLGRASPLRSNSSRNTNQTNTSTTSSGFGNFFGLFGGSTASSANNPSSNSNNSNLAGSTKTLHQSLPASAAAVGGGGAIFLSRRFNTNTRATHVTSQKSNVPNAAILQALEEEERLMVMSQIVATAHVFDEVVEDIIQLLNQ